jgi:hypothetical protein
MPKTKGSPKTGGRKKGTPNKTTAAMQSLLDGEAEALTRKAVELALGGNVTALKLCLDRIFPARRERFVSVALPAVQDARDLPSLTAALLSAVAKGELTAGEAGALSSLAANHGKALELADLEKRIARLEEGP